MDKKYDILIIDDDKFLLDMYSVKFNEQGFKVDVAFGGEEALKKLRDGYAPDVILLDIVMPGVDGFEFLEKMQKENIGGDPVVIVLSNQGQDTEIERAKKLGAKGYIVKASAIPSEVLERVIEIVEEKTAT